ncbi:SDR family NAD(P)-dependent oxidoreductase [Streptomyces sp. NBC_01465]|uniref:SDR family NAD(P)-dependent oxidoreductase n=1 Tax=Streptomyces sp. NBC_01465 TaxID=2903878 RepID=UPI002E32F277|nr:SDR family NAD(P)-dependent oxidoreductase [Streptomyces sp. NBC_01465]
MSKIWFVTGSSRGLGREYVTAALSRGDRVAATARNTDSLKDLIEQYGDAILPLAVDVTDRKAVFAAVEQAHAHFGRLDVILNNAGGAVYGAVEEFTEADLRSQLELNLFGPFHVTQAVLPYLREQGSGHIVMISTVAGLVSFPGMGAYNAAKHALEGLAGALAQEVTDLGIKVTIVEPGRYGTEAPLSSAGRAEIMAPYAHLRQETEEVVQTQECHDPAAAAAVMLKIVDAEQPPSRIFFGTEVRPMVDASYAEKVKSWDACADLTEEANGEPQSQA